MYEPVVYLTNLLPHEKVEVVIRMQRNKEEVPYQPLLFAGACIEKMLGKQRHFIMYVCVDLFGI